MQRRERILAIAIGVLAGGWLLDGVVVRPVLSWYDGVREAAAAAEAEVGQSQALIDRQARIMADWRARHAAGLLDDESGARFRMQTTLAEAARSSGVLIDNVGGGQLIPAARDETCDTLRLTASGQGSLAQVMDFQRALAGASQPLRVERSELSASDPRKDLLELSLTVSTRLVPAAARSVRRVPEGTKPWQPEQADASIGAAVVAAKPFLADRRGGPRSVVSETVRTTVAAPGGWALVGVVTRADGTVAFLRHLSNGSERMLAVGEEIDGQTASAIDAGGMVLGGGEAAKRITVGCDLAGAPVPNLVPTRRAAVTAPLTIAPVAPAAPGAITTPTTPVPAAAGAASTTTDPGREAILERLRQQRNRTP